MITMENCVVFHNLTRNKETGKVRLVLKGAPAVTAFISMSNEEAVRMAQAILGPAPPYTNLIGCRFHALRGQPGDGLYRIVYLAPGDWSGPNRQYSELLISETFLNDLKEAINGYWPNEARTEPNPTPCPQTFTYCPHCGRKL